MVECRRDGSPAGDIAEPLQEGAPNNEFPITFSGLVVDASSKKVPQ
jgi:hypothetical protein